MRKIFSWFDQSLSRKIGSLSTILLSFLFVVLIYSLFKLLQISVEMREVAEVDIPLTEVIAEIEVLQLEQHLIMEKLRLEKLSPNPLNKTERFDTLSQKFADFAGRLNHKVHQASQIITQGITNKHIAEKIPEHKQALAELTSFKQRHDIFQLQAEKVLSALSTENVTDNQWLQLEKTNTELDKLAIKLLIQVEALTEEIARNAEEHEREFLIVNTALGFSALVIGIYLTLYIIKSFRRRMGHIQGQIESLQESITTQQPVAAPNDNAADGKDELAELASDINHLMAQYDQQMANRYQLEEKLIELATTDKLTGAYNRHKWDEAINTEIEHVRRGACLSLIMFDVDFFKKINDQHGHDIGDLVLQHLTSLVKNTIRKSDALFRLGGEEFAVLLRDTNLAQAEKLLNCYATPSKHFAMIRCQSLPPVLELFVALPKTTQAL